MTGPTDQPEPFPALASERHDSFSSPPASPVRRTSDTRSRDRTASRSTLGGSIRRLSKQFEESSPPAGFMASTGDFASSLVSLDRNGPRNRRQSYQTPPGSPLAAIPSNQTRQSPAATPMENQPSQSTPKGLGGDPEKRLASPSSQPADTTERSGSKATSIAEPDVDPALTEPFDNGYHFPPKYTWQESTKQFMVTAWNFCTTFWGFFWFIYGLNVVAWGGMLFLLLCNAAPAMCYPTCDDINSPRRVWVEVDSQILNALFCVTGFGLAPWRFRDWYYLLRYRVLKEEESLRRLAGLKRDWFRLKGSQDLPLDVGPDNVPDNVPISSIPYPIEKIPDAPLTGVRASPTAPWKLDFFIWTMVWNTFLQAVLSGFMWGLNRYDRPSWSTGLFVALASIVAAVGGLVGFFEGKRVKSIEGVPLTDQDRERLARDKELGIPHYNNIKDKKPKEKGSDEEAGEKPSKAKQVVGKLSQSGSNEK